MNISKRLFHKLLEGVDPTNLVHLYSRLEENVLVVLLQLVAMKHEMMRVQRWARGLAETEAVNLEVEGRVSVKSSATFEHAFETVTK